MQKHICSQDKKFPLILDHVYVYSSQGPDKFWGAKLLLRTEFSAKMFAFLLWLSFHIPRSIHPSFHEVAKAAKKLNNT